MNAVKVVLVDCEKARLIGGPFMVLAIRGERLVASTSGLDSAARADTVRGEYVERFAHRCACCGEVCESGVDCCTDEFPEPADLREWA